MHSYKNNGDTSIEKAEQDQKQHKFDLNKIVKGNSKNKSKEKLTAIENIKNLYSSREKVIKLYNDYATILSDARHKAKYGTRIKMLTLKQMLHRLPIAIAQIKSGK